MPAKLSVNLNAIAMLRNRRDLPWPSVEALGRIALAAGASGLTVHPRPDQRHIRFSDLPVIRNLIDDEFPQAEFNIEGYPTEEFLELCAGAAPEQVTLVPDDPAQATSDHGWDFRKHQAFLTDVVARLKTMGCRVSLFADGDGDAQAVEIAKEQAADDGVDEVCVIGGRALFELALPKAKRLYLTEVAAEVDGDVRFPAFDESAWTEVRREVHPAGDGDDHAFVFRVLERR